MARLAAGVKRRADNTLEKRFTIDGKRYSVYGKTQKELVERELEKRKEIESGSLKNKKITLDKYFEEWAKRKSLEVKSNTIRAYRLCYKTHISPYLGKKKVCLIEKTEILALQQRLYQSLSATTTNETLKILHIILKAANDDDVIDKNPCKGIKPIRTDKKRASETIHRALTVDEQKIFMQEVKEEYYYEMIAFMLLTGTRCGEASALRWSDIDFANNVIHVNRTVTFTENGDLTFGDPKSAAGKRDIPINANIRAIIYSQKKKISQIAIPMSESLVFPSVNGHIIRVATVNNCIRRTLQRLNDRGIIIDHFSAHCLRDTFATRYIEAGGSPQTLKTILGHSSLAMTMDLYAHVLPNTKADEMNRITIAV